MGRFALLSSSASRLLWKKLGRRTIGEMPLALTVDIGWPWWTVVAIASGLAVACLAALFVFRGSTARAVAGLLAIEGIAIAIVAPFVMENMDRNGERQTASGAGMRTSPRSTVIHVIEHAPPQNMQMIGAVQTFANSIFDSRNVKRIGKDQGFCVRIALVKGYECAWTTFLPGGQISAEGPLSDTATTRVAIIGGTSRYEHARGWAESKVHNKAGTEFDIIFHVSV
jgi:hypothetical protein